MDLSAEQRQKKNLPSSWGKIKIQGISKCSPWLQTFITRKPQDLP
jgi:hypothetical protein